MANRRKPLVHGTVNGYVSWRCRCEECRANYSAYQAPRRRPSQLVSAEAVRKHALYLVNEYGFGGQSRLAELAGVPSKRISEILWGAVSRGRKLPPQRLTWTVYSNAILGVSQEQMVDVGSGHHRFMMADGTRRRVEALACLGWSRGQLCKMGGISEDGISERRLKEGRKVSRGTADRVRILYDKLWDQPAPDSRASRWVRGVAASRGYAPPMAWDDDQIDDPKAHPTRGSTDRVDPLIAELVMSGVVKWEGLRKVDRQVVAAAIISQGWSAERADKQAGINKRTYAHFRNRLRDLWRTAV